MNKTISLLLAIALLAFSQNLFPQAANYTFLKSNGTFTTLVGSGTPASSFPLSFDDNTASYSGLPFAFNFAGTSYTSFTVSSNGFIVFGSTLTPNGAGSAYSTTDVSGLYLGGTCTNNGVAGFNQDMQEQTFTTFTGTRTSGSTTITGVSSFTNLVVGMRLTATGITSGTIITAMNSVAGTITMSQAATSSSSTAITPRSSITVWLTGSGTNRSYVIQFIALKRFSTYGTGDKASFQIWLDEAGGVAANQTIRVIYGTATTTQTTTYGAQVGIRTTISDYNARTTTTNWASTTAPASNTATCRWNSTVFPASGLTFTWTPGSTLPPLSGTYTIGSAMFNKLSGLDLVFVTKTRKVKRLVESSENGLSRTQKKSGAELTSGLNYNAGKNPNPDVRYEEVEEQYSELCTKDGVKYTGSLYAPYTANGNGDNLLTAGDYATITAAISDLNTRGVSGAVTFLLLDGNYPAETYPVQFNSSISGISAVNKVTLRPQTGVTSIIPGSASGSAAMKILSSYITIDGSNSGGTDRSLTIKNTSTTSPIVFAVGSTGTTPVTNVTLRNCVITNGVNTTTAVVLSDGTTLGNAGYFNTITFQNNSINNAYIGIYAIAATGTNLFINNNLLNTSGVSAITGSGIYVQGVNGATISGNDIGNISNSDAATNERIGIWLATGALNITIQKNTIHDIVYTGVDGYPSAGLRISNGGTTGTGIVIKNNFIYSINSDGDSYASYGGTYSPIGIYCYGSAQTGISIYNNSIYLKGNSINYSAGSYSIGICLDDGSVADVRNNLVVNNEGLLGSTGAGALCLACETGSTQLSSCDYNDYYANPSAGIKGLVLMGVAGTPQTTIADARTVTGQDKQSFSSSPVFASETDLHINPAYLSVSGRGTYIASVNDDIDGNSRETAQSTVNRPVDVGADQYTPSGYAGNTAVLNGTIYQDGGANGVELVSGAFTNSGVTSFPGVRTPNNLYGKIQVKRTGNNNGQPEGPLSVNVPWLYYNIAGFNITSSPVTLRFYYNHEQLATIGETNLAVAMWTGSSWEIVPGQIVNTAGNYIQLSFSDWLGGGNWPSPMTFALTDITSPLPVDMCSFSASISARNISLAWKTCSEINNKGFDVERRVLVDPANNRYSDWVKAAFINGHGTSNEEHLYNYSDTKMPTGKYQYRLRQVDYNGHDEYFTLSSPDVVEIGKPQKADVSQNYPNPSNPKSRIDYQIPFDGMVSLKVYDIIGREITTIVNEIKEAGFYTAEFDGSSLASGVYFYRIIAEGTGSQKFTATKKMILVK